MKEVYRFGKESLADTNTPLEHSVRRGFFLFCVFFLTQVFHKIPKKRDSP